MTFSYQPEVALLVNMQMYLVSYINLKFIALSATYIGDWGSGCGSVGTVVASNTIGPQFKSSHQQTIIYILNNCFLSTVYRKDENKEKEAGNGPFLTKHI